MKYLIGTHCGGLMESPETYFTGPYRLIESSSAKEAIDYYNKLTKASYFYGGIMCIVDHDDLIELHDDVSKSQCRRALQLALEELPPKIKNLRELIK